MRFYRLHLLFITFVFIIFLAQGQTLRDTTKTNLNIALTGNIQTGNFDRLQFINNLNGSFDSQNRKWNFHTRHLYLFQKVFGNTSQDDYLTRNFIAYRFNKAFDIFGAFFFEKFLIKRIEHNMQYGAGLRYAVIDKPRAFIQFGLMGSYGTKQYVDSNFQGFDNGGSDTIDGFFISPVLNTKFMVVPKRLFFNFLFWFQQDVGESQNYRFNIETSLLAPVYKGLSLKLSFNDFYENINLVGAKANDTFLTYGLSYTFK